MSEGIKARQATLPEILETIAEVFDLRSHVIHERYDEIDDWETKAALADSRAAAIREAIAALAAHEKRTAFMRGISPHVAAMLDEYDAPVTAMLSASQEQSDG